MSALNKFILLSAGVDFEIIENCQNSRYENIKKSSIGLAVLLTSLFAIFSGGYGMFIATESILLSVIFGLLWGLIIWNLDRSLVSSFRITNNTSTNSRLLIRFFIPSLRIILAIMIGLVISVPVELSLFKEDINNSYRLSILESIKTPVDPEDFGIEGIIKKEEGIISGIFDRINSEQRGVDSILNDLINRLDEAELEAKNMPEFIEDRIYAKNQRGGDSLISIERTINPKVRRIKEKIDNLNEKIDEQSILANQDDFSTKKKDSIARNVYATEAEKYKLKMLFDSRIELGILKRYEKQNNVEKLGIAKEWFNAEGKKDQNQLVSDFIVDPSFAQSYSHLESLRKSGTNGWIVIGIRLLFIFVEVFPILVKSLTGDGEYEKRLIYREEKALRAMYEA